MYHLKPAHMGGRFFGWGWWLFFWSVGCRGVGEWGVGGIGGVGVLFVLVFTPVLWFINT